MAFVALPAHEKEHLWKHKKCWLEDKMRVPFRRLHLFRKSSSPSEFERGVFKHSLIANRHTHFAPYGPVRGSRTATFRHQDSPSKDKSELQLLTALSKMSIEAQEGEGGGDSGEGGEREEQKAE